tara:strand:+ start:53 stop:1051 length:999 start_codon:yes stop_codon:yes gene_type:complete
MSSDKKIIEKINECLFAKENFALALVIETWNSAPKPVGSILLLSESGEISGSVSGGCVESAVISEAQISLKTQKSKILKFGVTNEDAFQVGLACGGEIKILIEPITYLNKSKRKLLESFFKNYLKGNFSILKICLKSSKRELIENEEAFKFLSKTKKYHQQSFLNGESFYYILPPKSKLVVVGAVHIAQYLVEFANQFDFDIYVIDPRSSFANKKRFPSVNVIDNWPDEAFTSIKTDQNTAIITLTHDAKIDDIALQIALKSDCFYIGCLGSIKTHEKRIDRLLNMGFNKSIINRIHAPIGLDIGSRKPNEIALSIIAEIIKVKRLDRNKLK